MRHPRLSVAVTGDQPALVAVAHGSRDPRAAATVTELLSLVRARAPARPGPDGLAVRAAFLENCAPSLPQVLGSLGVDGAGGGTAVVVPLLLTAAYHSKTDIPAQLAAARGAASSGAGQDADAGELEVRCADTLGPHPLLLAAVERRLREAGVPVGSAADRARTSVVLAAAGSSDPAANASVAGLAAQWQRDRGWHAVVPAYASAAAPSPEEAVRALVRVSAHLGDRAPRVVVATYLLAPGYFADQIRASTLAAGASAVSAALGAAPEVADVILARYAAASRLDGSWPDSSHPERTVATPQLVTRSRRGDQGERVLRRVRRAANDLTR